MPPLRSHADPELSSLIIEAIEADLLKTGTREHEIARLVAEKGQTKLSSAERTIWELHVLPILSRPIRDQILLNSIARRGGKLPRRHVG